jgi:hypothetical protein
MCLASESQPAAMNSCIVIVDENLCSTLCDTQLPSAGAPLSLYNPDRIGSGTVLVYQRILLHATWHCTICVVH